jgi:hypothetical protein
MIRASAVARRPSPYTTQSSEQARKSILRMREIRMLSRSLFCRLLAPDELGSAACYADRGAGDCLQLAESGVVLTQPGGECLIPDLADPLRSEEDRDPPPSATRATVATFLGPVAAMYTGIEDASGGRSASTASQAEGPNRPTAAPGTADPRAPAPDRPADADQFAASCQTGSGESPC